MHAFSPVLNSSLIAEDEGLAQDLEPQSGAGRLSKSRPVRGGKFFGETMRRFTSLRFPYLYNVRGGWYHRRTVTSERKQQWKALVLEQKARTADAEQQGTN